MVKRRLGDLDRPDSLRKHGSSVRPTSQIYNIVIGHLLGITALGYWNVAMRVIDTMTGLLAQAANRVGLSLFAREQSALDVVRRGFHAATQMASLLCVPLFVGLIIVTHDLVALAFGDRWLPAVPIIQILAFGAMLYCVFMFGDVVFTALGRPISALFRRCFHFAISLIGLRVFHTSGLDAAALVWVGSSCLTLPLMLVKIRQLIQGRFVDILRNVACAALHCRQRRGAHVLRLQPYPATLRGHPSEPAQRRSHTLDRQPGRPAT